MTPPTFWSDPDCRVDRQFLSAMGALRPGQRLGAYELLLPIARGGMALVWAARRSGLGRKVVALKTVLPALCEDPRFHDMFTAEARIASRIAHPNVCSVLDHGRDGGVDYLVMEWIDGEALSALRPTGSCLPAGVAIRIALDIAKGLHAAHEQTDETGAALGIVHRDVSPQNILVAWDGTTKIADFGVAKATEIDRSGASSGFIKGKIDYLSPEQAFSERLDGRADVFALGVVLYEMTTGQRPFGLADPMATLVRLTGGEPATPPQDIIATYPPTLTPVVMRALEKDRRARYSTMNALARDLEKVAAQVGHSDGADVATWLQATAANHRQRRDRASNRALGRAVKGEASTAGASRRVHPRAPRVPLVAGLAALAVGLAWFGANRPSRVSAQAGIAEIVMAPAVPSTKVLVAATDGGAATAPLKSELQSVERLAKRRRPALARRSIAGPSANLRRNPRLDDVDEVLGSRE